MTSSNLTIVMYHYVRDLERSRYPGIKGLTTQKFRGQLDYLQRHFTFVDPEEVTAAVQDPAAHSLPENAAILTFDDGYSDHYSTVFPILADRRLSAYFFPVVTAVESGVLLDVNKIHFVLAAGDPNHILTEIFQQLDYYRAEYGLESNQAYFSRLAVASSLDTAEVIFIKRLLQRELVEDLRGKIVDHLFQKIVSIDQPAFAAELYMTPEQMRVMASNNMVFGVHGHSHYWLNYLSPGEQEREIDLSLDFLRRTGLPTKDWVMCYPFGGYDNATMEILGRKNCAFAVTTRSATARIGDDHRFELPRVDTVLLPTTNVEL